jgi:hypothetical protein
MDFNGKPYMTMFASCWGLLGASLLCAAPVIFFKIKEHTELEDDLRFSDETVGDVTGLAVAGNAGEESVPEKRKEAL